MKKILTFFICLACILSLGCSKEREVNGRSMKTANRSVSIMKEYLPPEQKLEFQIAFWTLKAANQNTSDFLDAIDGKTASELIALGKAKFEERRSAGFEDYQKFASWDAMIDNYRQQRKEQDLGIKKDRKQREIDRANNVLYKLR